MILNDNVGELSEMETESGLHRGLIEAVLDDFEKRGFIKCARYMGGGVSVHEASAQFKRWLRDT